MAKLFYVMGASGTGKDSVMNCAKSMLDGTHQVAFAHRYITRIPDTTENHIYLTPKEFKLREENRFFSLHWESHGNFYGIGREINYWMSQGFSVVVNGSRAYLPVAIKKYKDLSPILIETNPEILLKRLTDRGREDLAEIELRIKRNETFNISERDIIRIANNGPLNEAAHEFIRVITGVGKATPML